MATECAGSARATGPDGDDAALVATFGTGLCGPVIGAGDGVRACAALAGFRPMRALREGSGVAVSGRVAATAVRIGGAGAASVSGRCSVPGETTVIADWAGVCTTAEVANPGRAYVALPETGDTACAAPISRLIGAINARAATTLN